MPLDDRDYIRGKHPPACTCKECEIRRLGEPDYTTNVPFGGGKNPSLRGINTRDAANKGLLKWDGDKYIVPERNSIIATKTNPKHSFPQATKRHEPTRMTRSKRQFVPKVLVNVISISFILSALYFIYWILTQ